MQMTSDKLASTKMRWAGLPVSRRSSLKAVLGILALVALAIATASNWRQIQPIGAKAASNIIALLEGRSPGERAGGRLDKVKAELGDNGRQILFPPEERVLGKVFPPPASGSELGNPEELLALPLPPENLGIVLEELPAGLQTASLGGPLGGVAPGVPIYWGGGGLGGGGTSGGGGGGGGNGGSGTAPPDIITPVPAIPEPDTWALMLLGAYFCAAGLRHHRRKQIEKTGWRCAA